MSRGISCKDFFLVKQKIFMEQSKNSAISQQLLRQRAKDLCQYKHNADVIFDFIVRDVSAGAPDASLAKK